ncbi:DUF2975 domain-containing protein [Hirschia litorea]|uniref:DUF2975 domain-containing protein n=1 Tax=Hirschia litorea TaxID=1199156 RepID=A0ABW2IKA8_9PROT
MSENTLPRPTIRLCNICKWVTLLGAVLLVIQLVFGEGLNEIVSNHWNMLPSQIRAATEYSPMKKMLVYSIAALNYVGMFLLAGGIWRIFHTLQKYGPFSPQASNAMKFMGLSVFVMAAISIVLPTFMGLAITLNNPPQMHVFTVQLSAGSISMLLVGFVLRILGRAMLQAANIAEENRQFI